VFGLSSKRLDAPMPTPYYTLHKDGSPMPVAGVLQMNEQWAGVPPHWMPYIAVADIAAASTQIEALGGAIAVPAFDTPYGRISIVNDPQGAVFTVIQLAQNG